MRTGLAVFIAATLLIACESEGSGPEGEPWTESWTFEDGALVIDAGAAAHLRLVPAWRRVGGAWEEPAECETSEEGLRCAMDGGLLTVSGDGGLARVTFAASTPTEVAGLALQGGGDLPGARAWLSDGFQSWSQSGVLAIGAVPPEELLDQLTAVRADSEVMRDGVGLSWFWTAVGGGGETLVAGAVGAERFRPWATVGRQDDGSLWLRLASGASGERVPVGQGEAVSSEAWHLALTDDAPAGMRRYAERIPARRDARPLPAEAGWNSWYELWDGVDEAAVRENAALAREILSPKLPAEAPPLRIVVDDGWQLGWGWWEPNEKFPSGLDGLAADLRADGFTTGVWLAPLLVDVDLPLAEEHPEWLVGGARYQHPVHGRMGVLDVTHPGAEAHLREVIARIAGWGMDFLKIDFLFAGAFEGERHLDMTAMEAYGRALEIIREAAGEDVVLLAVGAPGIPSFPWVDAWRVGPDIAFGGLGPSWYFLAGQARNIAARWPLCTRVLCDADPPLLRDLGREEVETGGWVVALSGGALFLSDDLRVLPEERRSWGVDTGRAALAMGGEPAEVLDPWPADPPEALGNIVADHVRGELTQRVPVRWELPDGRRLGINVGDDALEVDGVAIPPRGARLLEAP